MDGSGAEDRALSPTLLFGVAVGVALVVLLVGRLDAWAQFLCSDVSTYMERVADAFDRHTLNGGEYQPGALLFFAFVRWLQHFALGFCDALEGVNCLLLAAHLVVLHQIGGRRGLVAGAVLFLCIGPIAMYRFELLVSLVVLLAWLAWRRGDMLLAGALLAWGVTIKVYPIVLFPVFFLGARTLKAAGRVAIGGIVGLSLVLTLFALHGGPLDQLAGTLAFHGKKPVALESVLGTTLQVMQNMHLTTLHEVDEYGIHGFQLPEAYRIVPTLLVVGAIAAAWLLAWRRRPFSADTGIAWLASVLASSVVISTLYVPQYLIWMTAFVALLHVAGLSATRLWRLVTCLGLAALAQQYVYPVNYQLYLDVIATHTAEPTLLLELCLFGGKLLLVAFFVMLQRDVLHVVRGAGAPAGAPEPFLGEWLKSVWLRYFTVPDDGEPRPLEAAESSAP